MVWNVLAKALAVGMVPRERTARLPRIERHPMTKQSAFEIAQSVLDRARAEAISLGLEPSSTQGQVTVDVDSVYITFSLRIPKETQV